MVTVCKNKLESIKNTLEKIQDKYKVIYVEDIEAFINADVDALLPDKSDDVYGYVHVLPIECEEILPVSQKEKVKEIIYRISK